MFAPMSHLFAPSSHLFAPRSQMARLLNKQGLAPSLQTSQFQLTANFQSGRHSVTRLCCHAGMDFFPPLVSVFSKELCTPANRWGCCCLSPWPAAQL